MTQWEVLEIIEKSGLPLCSQDIARKLDTSSISITRQLSGLRKYDMVRSYWDGTRTWYWIKEV